MLRLKANVGIKWVYWKDKCHNFCRTFVAAALQKPRRKPLMRRGGNTGLICQPPNLR